MCYTLFRNLNKTQKKFDFTVEFFLKSKFRKLEFFKERWMDMKFNHSKLLGRMKECGFTQEKLAQEIGINKGTLSVKLNSQFYFTSKEMSAICDVLNIPVTEIGEYFFAV